MPTAPKTHRPHGTATAQHREQQRRMYDQQRGTAHERGYTYEWAQYSQQRRIDHPLCEACLTVGVPTPATCTDHTIPVEDADDPLFWEPRNHRSLCRACHDWKTIAFDGGFGARVRPAERTLQGVDRRWGEVVQARRERENAQCRC